MTRMIDADALNKKLCETTIFIEYGEVFQRMINDAPTIEPDGDLIRRQDALDILDEFEADIEVGKRDAYKTHREKLLSIHSAYHPLCALADRECPFQGKEYAWCLTCPHISEEDRELVKKAIAETKTGECRTCKRNADNGGVYEDGRTKCPIQEHYALLLDGYCHLYEQI